MSDRYEFHKTCLTGILSLFIAAPFLLGGLAKAETLGFSVNASSASGTSDPSHGDVAVLVLDDDTLKPLSDSSVTLADSFEDENSATRAITGPEGNSLFKGALSHRGILTVSKAGYTTVSIVGVQAAQITVFLKPLAPASSEAAGDSVIASGTLKGWPASSPDDVVKTGLVLKTLSALDLLHFEPDSVISPLKDTIQVLGSHEIPSNLVLPEQEVSLFFTSLTLNKPTFRLPLKTGKAFSLAGVQAMIPVSDLISLAQTGGKPSLALLNKLKFTRAGISPTSLPTRDFSLDVDADLELTPQHRVTVSEAPFQADIIIASATDMTGDRNTLLPTDLKLASAAGHTGLIRPQMLSASNASVGQGHLVLTIAMSEKGRRLTGILSDQAGSTVNPGSYLAVDGLPDGATVPDSLSLQPLPTGISAVVYEAGSRALWYVYTLPSAGMSAVPSHRLPSLDQVTSFSVIQLDFGAGFDEHFIEGQSVMRKLTRFARSTGKVVKPLF